MKRNDSVPGSIEGRMDEMARRLRSLEERVASLESSLPYGEAGLAPSEATLAEEAAAGPAAGPRVGDPLPLIGRTLLVLAGAFVLRAITEAGTLDQTAGTVLGLVYAVAWFLLADRAAVRGRRAGAVFHGLAGSIIAFPLLVESTVRFEVLPPTLAALILAGLASLGLTIAGRRQLHWLAWVVSAGAAVAIFALAGSTRMWISFVALLLALALADLWLGYLKGWRYLGWALAALTDAALVLLVIVALRGDAERVELLFRPVWLVGLLLAAVIGYFASFFLRTAGSEREISPGEAVQGFVLLPICLGGALALVERGQVGPMLLGLTALLLAAGCYAAAFAVMDRSLGRRRNFVFYSASALAFTLAAADALLAGPPLVFVLSVLAVAAAWLGGRRERATLSLHGAVYVTAAAFASGLPRFAIDALLGPTVPAPAWIDPPVLAVVAAAALFCWHPVATHGRTLGVALSWIPKFAVMGVLTLALGGMVATFGSRLLPHAEDGAIALTVLAPLRTFILAGAAVFLAWLCRVPRLKEAAWLVYPVLIAGGLHLLWEDVRTGRPVTLVVSFALYGTALILSPRLVRRGTASATPAEEGEVGESSP